MPFVYCAFSPKLDLSLRRREGAPIFKFGSTANTEERRDAMNFGWLQPNGRRGPPLALVDDWDYVAIALGDRDDERVIFQLLKHRSLQSASSIEDAMRASVARGLKKQTNGVGELRCLSVSDISTLMGRPLDPAVSSLLGQTARFVHDLMSVSDTDMIRTRRPRPAHADDEPSHYQTAPIIPAL